jgi:hypothetical protein
MAYYLVRLYSGSGDRPMEQLIQETVVNDLVPKLQEGGGLQRYLAVITDDGRTGSASLYESKKAADRGLQIAREWAQNTGAMRGYQLTSAFGGQVIRQRHGEAHGQRVTHGVARLYDTSATAEQVADAIEQYGDPAVDAIQGRARPGALFTFGRRTGLCNVAAFCAAPPVPPPPRSCQRPQYSPNWHAPGRCG